MSIEADFQTSFQAFNSRTTTAGASKGPQDLLSKFGLSLGLKKENSSSTLNVEDEQNTSLLDSFQSGISGGLASIGLSQNTQKNRDAECMGLSTFQRYLGFFMMIGASLIFFMISFFTLPMVVLMPGKFATSFTFGSLLFLSSFTVLNGWRAHLKHLFCWDRALFTSAYLLSMMGCLYFSVISASYLGVLFFTILELLCLTWYFASYVPGGTGFMTRMARSTIGLPV